MSTFEMKGVMAPLTVLRLLSTDTLKIEDELQVKISESPTFFQESPLIIDITALNEKQNAINMPSLVHLLRKSGLVPVGLKSSNEIQKEIAATLQLSVFPEIKVKNKSGSNESANKPVSQPIENTSALFVKQKIRSGQRVHAKGRDLIILNSVSHGAEVIADGHIHIYGTLFGRAMAGGINNTAARIFCQSLEAELVSVAGHYRINEDLNENIRGQQVQIFLKDAKQLVIERI